MDYATKILDNLTSGQDQGCSEEYRMVYAVHILDLTLHTPYFSSKTKYKIYYSERNDCQNEI